jgi:hypothetical protein
MNPQEILTLSAAIARRTTIAELALGTKVARRRATELSLVPRDPRHADVIVELDPGDDRGERVKGVRIRLAQPEDLNWDALTEQLGPFTDQAELSGRPEVAPTRVATARPVGALAQTIRVSIDRSGHVTSFVVREHSL